jgi:hypothetical protein
VTRDEALVALGLVPGPEVGITAAAWEASQRTYPPGGPPFLAAAFVAQAGDDAALPAEIRAAAGAAAGRVRADPALRALAWHAHRVQYASPPGAYPREDVRAWPLLAAAVGPDADLLYLLVLLSGMPRLMDLYRQRRIPPSVARETLSDLERWVRRYRRQEGSWGLRPRGLTWLRNHLEGQLFQLSRLQHQLGAFGGDVRVYRQATSGDVVALASDGLRFDADGRLAPGDGAPDGAGVWRSVLETEAHPAATSGAPVSPGGFARHERLTLPAAAWTEALVPGDPVLQLHIPDGSPMDFDACGESLRLALEFFPRHFPEHRFRAFACSSWLLDPLLQRLLPPDSNVVRFQREVYLYPSPADGRQMLETVFGAAPEDDAALAGAPQETTLQRALAAHLRAGGRAGSGRCFLLRDDLRWGEAVYHRRPSRAAGGTP